MNPGNLGNCYIVEFFNAKYWINPYSTNVSLLYPLKTSENLRFFDVFSGYGSETLVENRLNWQAFHPVAGINCQARKVLL